MWIKFVHITRLMFCTTFAIRIIQILKNITIRFFYINRNPILEINVEGIHLEER